MSSFEDHVPLPPLDTVNQGLSACRQATMLTKFGRPGALTKDCSDPTGEFQKRVTTASVGPFKVTGLDYAVESLKQIFAQVRQDNFDLFQSVRSDGMLCVRARRVNPSIYSNHSWGTAIDLYFGDGSIDQGTPLAQRGIVLLVKYFNKSGWYWGGGFSGDSVDSMHFELANETVLQMGDQPLATATSAQNRTIMATEIVDVQTIGGVGRTKIGTVCDEWDYDNKTCQSKADVFIADGTTSPYFVTKLAIDADGAPKAYHPDDTNCYDYLANLNSNDNKGIQGKDAIGPAPGYYVSATSLQDSQYSAKDTRRYVDASTIPYIVLIGSGFPAATDGHAPTLGSVALVVDLNTGGSSGALFADTGRAVGEGSIALALRLGLRPFSTKAYPKVVGPEGKQFLYLLFPAHTVAPPWTPQVIQTIVDTAFADWGGEARLKSLFPTLPALQPPTNVLAPL